MQSTIKTLSIALLLGVCFFGTSCATVLGGKVTTCQAVKPKEGTEPRQVRIGYLIVDVLFGLVPIGVDFLTNAIYKPCPETAPKSVPEKSK